MLRGPSRPMEEVTEDKAFRCYTAPGETFATEAEMKAHYHTELHRFNLKRKVAGLAPLTRAQFEARAAASARRVSCVPLCSRELPPLAGARGARSARSGGCRGVAAERRQAEHGGAARGARGAAGGEARGAGAEPALQGGAARRDERARRGGLPFAQAQAGARVRPRLRPVLAAQVGVARGEPGAHGARARLLPALPRLLHRRRRPRPLPAAKGVHWQRGAGVGPDLPLSARERRRREGRVGERRRYTPFASE